MSAEGKRRNGIVLARTAAAPLFGAHCAPSATPMRCYAAAPMSCLRIIAALLGCTAVHRRALLWADVPTAPLHHPATPCAALHQPCALSVTPFSTPPPC
jgi:hypothetical protein